tara:strand:+ start:3505 stop:3975 length:471 start_codon:yes stop_codon:yes gene_type:complete
MFSVINNFTNNQKFYALLNIKENFPWYLEPNTAIFKHVLIKTNDLNKREVSPFSQKIAEPLLEKLQNKIIYNLQIKFIVPTTKIKTNDFNENDPENNNYIGILSLNSNDGSIKIYDQEKIKNEENRFVTFNKNIPYYHSTSTDLPNIFLEIEYGDN